MTEFVQNDDELILIKLRRTTTFISYENKTKKSDCVFIFLMEVIE